MELEVTNKEKKVQHYAVDFDGVLAHYEKKWKGQKVGEPIIPMVNKVKQWLNDGISISIYTARLSHPECNQEKTINMIKEFLLKAGLPENLDISCIKWYYYDRFYDDKAYRVEENKGIIRDYD